LPTSKLQLKKILPVRRWLLFFLLILPCIQLAAQDSAVKHPSAVVPRDTTLRKKILLPDSVRRKIAFRRDSLHRAHIADSVRRVVKDSIHRARVADSTRHAVALADSLKHAVVPPAPDTTHRDTTALAAIPPKPSGPTPYELYMKKLQKDNLFFRSDKPVRADINVVREAPDYDWLVYLMAGVVLLLGIIRLSYLKYFSDLFRAFMNPTLSQRQLKDQLSQSPFPNFLLNAFFVISLGMYLYLIMYRQQYAPDNNPLMAIPAMVVLVALVYSVKYVMLRFCGWLFGSIELADAYIFILYLINKVLGILLLPFLVILAFCQPGIAHAFIYISVFFIVLLVGYRYVRAYSVVKQYLSFSRLHFFLYLCAFEVAPVLIITKVLLVWLTGGH
jgi:hypothetical protein